LKVLGYFLEGFASLPWAFFYPYYTGKIKNLPPPSTTPTTIIVTAFYGWKEVLSYLPSPSTGVNLFKDLL
jgi:hypothetical protein